MAGRRLRMRHFAQAAEVNVPLATFPRECGMTAYGFKTDDDLLLLFLDRAAPGAGPSATT